MGFIYLSILEHCIVEPFLFKQIVLIHVYFLIICHQYVIITSTFGNNIIDLN
jgi:hypothetical protein